MTTTVTKTIGAGKNYATFALFAAYVNGLDLVALDQTIIGVAYDNITIAPIGPVKFDGTRRVEVRPAPGMGVNELETLGLGVGGSGVALLIPRGGSYTGVKGGVDIYNFRWLLTGSGAAGIAYESPGTLGAGYHSNIIRYNRIYDTGTNTDFPSATGLSIGTGAGDVWFADNLMVADGGTQQVILKTASSAVTIERCVFAAIGASKNIVQAVSGGVGFIRDTVFIGFGPTIIGSASPLTNCFSNTTPTAGVTTGFTVNTGLNALVVNEASDWRPAANSPLIGAASVNARNTTDILGGFRGTSPDVGAAMRTAAALPAAPNATITNVTVVGQKVTVTGTFTGQADSGTVSVAPSGTPNGAVAATGSVLINGSNFTATVTNVKPGNYLVPSVLLTNIGGTGTCTGGAVFTVAIPPMPSAVVTAQSKIGQSITLSGTHAGNPAVATMDLPAAATPNGAVARSQVPVTLNDNGTWTVTVSGVAYGAYGAPVVTFSNFTGTATANGSAVTVYAPGTQPPGLPAVNLPAYAAPAFTNATVALNAAVTSITLDSTSGAAQNNVPFTIGHTFKAGDLAPGDYLVGKVAGQADIPLQFNIKATHFNGSVRHGVISGIVPSLAAGASVAIALTRVASSATAGAGEASSVVTGAGLTASATATIGGVLWTADATAVLAAGAAQSKIWLAGGVATEWVFVIPFKNASNVDHPALTAQFSVRHYPGANKAKIDVVFEHTKAFTAINDINYDAAILVGGVSVYTKAGLVHFPAGRWKKTVWWNTAPAVHVRHNTAYLIASKAVPNYDQRISVSADTLNNYPTIMADAAKFGPMGPGPFAPFMGGTGGRRDIGLMPDTYAATVLSMDKRAKDLMLASADCAGSWPMNRRDTSAGPGAGMPLSVVNWPSCTAIQNTSGINNDTGQDEHIPAINSVTINEPDVSHHPNFAYLPYLLTGDYFYLEQLQFSLTFMEWCQNPFYRGYSAGLLDNEQLRGQGWALRTAAETAAITPDAHPLKSHFMYFVNNTLAAHNGKFTDNPSANLLGINDTNIVYWAGNTTGNAEVGTGVFQDDFFTQSTGHAAELGFTEAARLLRWKAKFQVGRMIAPGVCWIHAAIFALKVRDSVNSPIYTTLAECYTKTAATGLDDYLVTSVHELPCGSQERLTALNDRFIGLPVNPFVAGEMTGYGTSTEGFPANYQPALAMAVDSGYTDGDLAWSLFDSRARQPQYGTAPQFAIVPRTVTAGTPPAATVTSVTVSPVTAAGSQQFAAVVNGANSPSQAVTWSKTGGGTLSTGGAFVAPAATGSVQTITITATSVLDPTKSGTATVTIAAAVTPPATRTVTVRLFTAPGVAAANLSGLKWAWHDQPTPNLWLAPTDKGAAGTSNAQGDIVLALPNSALSIGATGNLTVTTSTGVAGAAFNVFSGPAVVA